MDRSLWAGGLQRNVDRWSHRVAKQGERSSTRMSSTFRRRDMTMTSWGCAASSCGSYRYSLRSSSWTWAHGTSTSCIQLVAPFSTLHDDDDVDGTTLFVSIFRSVLHFADMSHDPCGVVRLPLASSSSSSCSSATITGTTTTPTTPTTPTTTSCSTTLM